MRHSAKIAPFIFLAFFSPVSHASTIGSTETLGSGKWGVALDSDYVFERELRDVDVETYQRVFSSNNNGPLSLTRRLQMDNVKIQSLYRSGGQVRYGLLDKLDVYLNLGTSQRRIEAVSSGNGDANIFGVAASSAKIYGGEFKLKTDNALAWGGGFKVAQEHNGWIFGFDGGYMREDYGYKASINEFLDLIDLSIVGLSFRQSWHGDLTSHEWRAAPYVARRMGPFTPYAGFVYTFLRMKDKQKTPVTLINSSDVVNDLSSEGYSFSYLNKNNFGAFVGVEYRLNEHWSINLEGRFLDEQAISLTGNYIF